MKSVTVSPIFQPLPTLAEPRLPGHVKAELQRVGFSADVQGLQQFQAARGLPVTGTVDARTSKALKVVAGVATQHQDLFVPGMKNQKVLQAERGLKALGYQVGQADGIYDQATAEAVKAFKVDHPGLKNQGRYLGTPTASALQREVQRQNHAPEHVRVAASKGHRRLDALTQKAISAPHADGSTGLTVGDQGRAVRNVELHLKAAGFSPQNANGVFDERTQAAVKAFQRHAKLPVTGAVDVQTWAELKKSYLYVKKGQYPAQTLGERSAQVLHSERLLKKLGYHVKVDGLFDGSTLRASRAFENKHHGLGTSGAIGLGQLKAMKAAAARGRGEDAYRVAHALVGKAATWLQTHGSIAADMTDGIPANVNCANFVSACLEKAGLISHRQHDVGVSGLADNLRADKDFRRVSLAHAKPGDVCIVNGGGHVVMFAGRDRHGNALFIGSNNDYSRGGAQYVSIKGGYSPIEIFQYRH